MKYVCILLVFLQLIKVEYLLYLNFTMHLGLVDKNDLRILCLYFPLLIFVWLWSKLTALMVFKCECNYSSLLNLRKASLHLIACTSVMTDQIPFSFYPSMLFCVHLPILNCFFAFIPRWRKEYCHCYLFIKQVKLIILKNLSNLILIVFYRIQVDCFLGHHASILALTVEQFSPIQFTSVAT